MTTGQHGCVLWHGTTRKRAEAILKKGPDPKFLEPHGFELTRRFSTARPAGPFPLGSPQDYARGKANNFPDEGGPAILEIEVPEELVKLAECGGVEVRFDFGSGLEELLQVWATLPKRIL